MTLAALRTKSSTLALEALATRPPGPHSSLLHPRPQSCEVPKPCSLIPSSPFQALQILDPPDLWSRGRNSSPHPSASTAWLLSVGFTASLPKSPLG